MKKNKIKKYVDKLNKPKRLNKYLADAGIASRRKADELIARGLVRINGKPVTEMGIRVSPGDRVDVDGDPVPQTQKKVYIIMNKPKNVITTTSDDMDRRSVIDLIRVKERVYPVGRLDRNTTGVLLLTNDGELANRLMHPRYGVIRTYNVRLNEPLNPADAQKISHGLDLGDFSSLPCEVFIHPDDNSKISVSLQEGKNHEVKRLFDAVGYKVKQLNRIEYAGLTLKNMKNRLWRFLNDREIRNLRKRVGL